MSPAGLVKRLPSADAKGPAQYVEMEMYAVASEFVVAHTPAGTINRMAKSAIRAAFNGFVFMLPILFFCL